VMNVDEERLKLEKEAELLAAQVSYWFLWASCSYWVSYFWFLLLQKVAILHVLLKGQLMYCIQVVSSGVTRWYVQGAGGPNHYPLCRPLYGLDDCLYRVKVKMRWSMPIPRLLQVEWGYCWHFWIVMFPEC
jgi:hypothetical protein